MFDLLHGAVIHSSSFLNFAVSFGGWFRKRIFTSWNVLGDMALGSSSASERQREESDVLAGLLLRMMPVDCFRCSLSYSGAGIYGVGDGIGVSRVIGWCAAGAAWLFLLCFVGLCLKEYGKRAFSDQQNGHASAVHFRISRSRIPETSNRTIIIARENTGLN